MIAREQHKNKAKSLMNENRNLSGMIGVNILASVMSVLSAATVIFSLAGLTALITLLVSAVYAGGAASLFMIFEIGGSWTGSLLAGSVGLLSILFGFLSLALGLLIGAVIRAMWGPMEAGKTRYYLFIAKNGVRTSAASVLEGFDCFLNLVIVYGAKSLTVNGCVAIVSFVGGLIGGLVLNASPAVAIIIFVLTNLLSYAVCIYIEAQLWAVRWIMGDHPQWNAGQVLNESIRICRGHLGDIIVLWLSFLGWKILDAVTFKLSNLLYTNSYYYMAQALIYAEMKGEPISLDKADNKIVSGGGMTIGINPNNLIEKINQAGASLPGNQVKRAPEAPASIMGLSGMYKGSSFPLEADREVIIGRDASVSGIVISSGGEKVSRRHCSVRFNSRSGSYEVVDFSSNGVFVNGKRLPANVTVTLQRGTQIALGNNNNTFRLV